MSHFEFEKFVRECASKFDYAFTSLCFGTLALSLQFSSSVGDRYPILLVVSWSLFLAAGLAGGWRLMMQPVYYRNNLYKAKIDDTISKIQLDLQGFQPSPDLLLSNIGIVHEAILKQETLEQSLKTEDEKSKLAEALLSKLAPKFTKVFTLQLYTYLGGLAASFFFYSLNYLSRTGIYLCH